ncbi:MFS transporter [Planomonospora parontospora]|nr:MFS transporter [Planomonospora parontospora]
MRSDMPGIEAEPRLPAAFWRLWWATGVTAVGDGVFAAAIALLTVTITRDPRLVSAVSAAAYLPWLLLSLPVGVFVDRCDRVGLLRPSQAIQAVIVTVLAVLAASGRLGIEVLAALAFGLGACTVVSANAAQAIVPDLAAGPLLHTANGHQQTITTIGREFAGPMIGSLLFAVAAALPFGVDAVLLTLSAVLLAALPRRGPRRVRHPPMRTAVADGLRWLARHRLLRTLALLLGANTFCAHLASATLVLLATQVLHLGTRGYGLLLAGAATGSLLGGLTGARLITRFGAIPVLLAALTANVIVFVGIGLSPNATALGVLLAGNGFIVTLWNIVTLGLRQQTVPSGMLGRVNSAYRMIGWGLIPLGALAGGLVAHAFGLRVPYLAAGVLRGIALLVALPVLIRSFRTCATAPSDGTTRHRE